MLVIKPYLRENALMYAARYAFSQNPVFGNFAGIGGNCTNFVSQAILAGSCTMDYSEPFGWFYISDAERSPSWTGVEFLHDFLVGAGDFTDPNLRAGPYGRDVRAGQTQIGDVVQLARAGDFYHTLIISGFAEGETLVCAHTNDALDKPLSSYNFASLRYIHIEGVRVEVEDDNCFTDVFEGISLGLPDSAR